jgi:TRAP transporter 4TM/12TM fusion protein
VSAVHEDPARELLENEIGPRELRGILLLLASAIAVAMSLFHLYVGGFGALVDMRQRSLHLAFALVLAFLHYPLLRRWRSSFPVLLIDLALAALAGVVAAYPFLMHEQILQRVGDPSPLDIVMAVALTLLILEATRRSISFMLPIVALVFLAYALLPQAWLPELIAHRDYSLRRVMDQMLMATEGIFGVPLGVSATYVFLFVFFGSALEALGAGQYLIDLSVSLMGRFRGGPAKAAVLASGAMGTISGSSIANTVTTGVITIPLMRKVGFPAVNAGAVEVAASTNGQLVPPVMGAAAFIMAETLGVSYGEVVRAAILPALLSYTAIFAIVHLDAVKLGLGSLDRKDIPPFFFTFFRGAHYLIPLVQLLALLIMGRTPMYAAFYSIVSALFLLLIEIPVRKIYNLLFSHPLLRYSPEEIEPFTRVARRFGRVFVLGARNMIGIACACACCGMIIGVVSLTGLAGQISNIIVTLAGGKLLPTLIISVFVAIILGMGLPTTATYIMMAAMVAPAILAGAAEAGVELPLIAVHMFVFYYGIVADDTPPVGLCAYAAAGISGADPIRTGLKSFSLDLAAFTLPFMFIYNPELLLIDVHLTQLPFMLLFAVLGMIAFSVAIQGYFAGPVLWWGRLLALLSAFLLVKPQIVPSLVGVAVLALLYVLSRGERRRRPSAGLPAAAP